MTEDLATLAVDLTIEDRGRRLAAAETLCHMGEEARAAAVALVRAVGDADESVREAAIGALEGLGPANASDVSALAKLLQENRGDVAYWAATLLGRLGADASEAVAALSAARDVDRPVEVQRRVAWALGKISPI